MFPNVEQQTLHWKSKRNLRNKSRFDLSELNLKMGRVGVLMYRIMSLQCYVILSVFYVVKWSRAKKGHQLMCKKSSRCVSLHSCTPPLLSEPLIPPQEAHSAQTIHNTLSLRQMKQTSLHITSFFSSEFLCWEAARETDTHIHTHAHALTTHCLRTNRLNCSQLSNTWTVYCLTICARLCWDPWAK